MREIKMNLWDAPPNAWIGIPTNGTVTSDGRLVMGAGVAQQARDRFKDLDLTLGRMVKDYGNKARAFHVQDKFHKFSRVFSFPTKKDWKEKSILDLISSSASSLGPVAAYASKSLFYLPRPGCGCGGLLWQDVKPVIEPLLPDNVIIVHL